MSLLDNLDSTGVESNEKDSLGGGGYQWDTGAYDCIIKLAYLDTNPWGGLNINYQFENTDGETLKISESYADKDGKTYGEYNGKKTFKQGFNRLNAICNLAAGKSISQMKPEEKMVSIYDFDEKKEVTVAKEVLMDLINQPITLGVVLMESNKKKLEDKEWVPTNDKKISNRIDKLFRSSDKLTNVEIKAGVTSPEFYDKWVEKMGDETQVTYKHIDGAPEGKAAVESKPTPKDIF